MSPTAWALWETVANSHVHVTAWESGTGPDHAGVVSITAHCECGHTHTYTDSTF